MPKRLLATLCLSLLTLSPAFAASRTGPVTAADCSLSSAFAAQRPSKDACSSNKFFDKKPGLLNAKSSSKVCLGFAGAIDKKLNADRSYCKRLTAQNWTPGLNMRFIECASDGNLGKVVWVTRASDISKTYKGWENAVTFAEMCMWKQLGNSFPK